MGKAVVIWSIIGFLLISCGGGQKPSPRVHLLPNPKESDIKVEKSSHKIVIPYKRTASGLIEVCVSINGVPFNMCWDTGSTVTSISWLELAKLAKEHAITEDDMISNEDIDGNNSYCSEKIFNINEFLIYGIDNNRLTFYNIPITVHNNYSSLMRIGQDIIRKLPKHTFNEDTMFIEFETTYEF